MVEPILDNIVNPPDPIVESIDGDRFRLVEDYTVKFGYWLRGLQFNIPAGFKSDLASIPWYLRWWNDRASLGVTAVIIHDYLCVTKGLITTLEGNNIQLHWFDVCVYFLVAMRIDGIGWGRALWAFTGVLIGAPKWRRKSPTSNP